MPATYTPLLSDPDAADAQDDGWRSPTSEEKPYVDSRLSDFASRSVKVFDKVVPGTLVLLACTLSLVSLVLTISGHYNASVAEATHTKLAYPNPYIGLEKAVLLDSPTPAPIINFPHLLAQVNSSNPTTVYLQQPHWPTYFGTLYPNDRRFLVTNEVSTIAQFRMMDYGMERCVAKLEMPSSTELAQLPEKRFSLSGTPFPLEIWALAAGDDIDPHKLSWSTRPLSTQLLLDVTIDRDVKTIESPEFACPSRTLLAFELRCGTPDCHLQFNQSNKAPRLGK
ncbi:hypothetical protein GGX14DRAFT_380957 [Mycena pura]|uniref:Ubiquitin 3 binding protein But2 C-terminal domain-containing protein n=1 Tax=Mycena pura TaxID=153505 RepID=A0AAD6UTA9_9AGAR|nr:hypothetical protein GGX14DRAFT_380957 [Mycena pura]